MNLAKVYYEFKAKMSRKWDITTNSKTCII